MYEVNRTYESCLCDMTTCHSCSYECFMSHMDASCQIWMWHHAISQMNASCHMWMCSWLMGMSLVTYEWVMSHMDDMRMWHDSFPYGMTHLYTSCHIWMSPVMRNASCLCTHNNIHLCHPVWFRAVPKIIEWTWSCYIARPFGEAIWVVGVWLQLFTSHLPQLNSVLPHLQYKSLCDSRTQNMSYMLSTLSTGPSCLPFPPLKGIKHLVCEPNRKNTTKSVPTNVLILKIKTCVCTDLVVFFRFDMVRFTKLVVWCLSMGEMAGRMDRC